VIFSSTEHGCEFERRVSDGEQSGKPQVKVSGCLFFLGTSFLDKQKRSTSPVKGETYLKGIKEQIYFDASKVKR